MEDKDLGISQGSLEIDDSWNGFSGLGESADDECTEFLKQKIDAAATTIASFEKSIAQQRKEQEKLIIENKDAENRIHEMDTDLRAFERKCRTLTEEKEAEKVLRFKFQEKIKDLQQELCSERESHVNAEDNVKKLEEELKEVCIEKQQITSDARTIVRGCTSMEEYVETMNQVCYAVLCW